MQARTEIARVEIPGGAGIGYECHLLACWFFSNTFDALMLGELVVTDQRGAYAVLLEGVQ